MNLLKTTFLSLTLCAPLICAASFSQGLLAFDQGRFVEAFNLWTRSANDGHSQAQFNLAVMFEQGIGTEKNLQKAFFWYSKAANQGDIEAQASLAAMYELGRGVEKNLNDARKWYARVESNPSSISNVQSLKKMAIEKLQALPKPETHTEVKFDGGRFLFSEASDGYCLIVLQGRITYDTTLQFKQVAKQAKQLGCEKNTVLLESRGGSLTDGFELGKEMRFEGYRTIVRDSCASSCGLIFIGGVERVMYGSKARIGLHQPRSVRENESFCANQLDGNGIKELRSFLRFMIPDTAERVFDIVMKTPCDKMTWVTGAQTIDLGIATKLEKP